MAAEDPAVVAASFRASEAIFTGMGAMLFAEFCRHAATDGELLELAGHAMAGARPAHLFSAVHYLLLGDPGEPLARHFATIVDDPLSPQGSWPLLAEFCRRRRVELLDLLRTRSVQTTYADRCCALLPPMCEVARAAGEPLNLIEIGCSAGVLLTFDHYAYRLDAQGLIGSAAAPVLLHGTLRDGPELFIPRIGRRIGIDLHVLDARSPEDRRWLLALCFPELREEQRRLAAALDVVAASDIIFLEGDGLARLAEALAMAPDPLCVYHSACLFYWPVEARAALEAMLVETSRTRNFWRIAIEPSDTFDRWQQGQAGDAPALPAAAPSASRKTGEITIFEYAGGAVSRRPVGRPNSDYSVIDWHAQAPAGAGASIRTAENARTAAREGS